MDFFALMNRLSYFLYLHYVVQLAASQENRKTNTKININKHAYNCAAI